MFAYKGNLFSFYKQNNVAESERKVAWGCKNTEDDIRSKSVIYVNTVKRSRRPNYYKFERNGVPQLYLYSRLWSFTRGSVVTWKCLVVYLTHCHKQSTFFGMDLGTYASTVHICVRPTQACGWSFFLGNVCHGASTSPLLILGWAGWSDVSRSSLQNCYTSVLEKPIKLEIEGGCHVNFHHIIKILSICIGDIQNRKNNLNEEACPTAW